MNHRGRMPFAERIDTGKQSRTVFHSASSRSPSLDRSAGVVASSAHNTAINKSASMPSAFAALFAASKSIL